MMTMRLRFTGNPTDSLFLWASRVLIEHGVNLSEKRLRKIYHKACDHFFHARRHFGNFWEKFEDRDSVDLLSPEKCFFGLLLRKVGIKPETASPTTKARMASLRKLRGDVAVAMSHFFNTMICYLRVPSLNLIFG